MFMKKKLSLIYFFYYVILFVSIVPGEKVFSKWGNDGSPFGPATSHFFYKLKLFGTSKK